MPRYYPRYWRRRRYAMRRRYRRRRKRAVLKSNPAVPLPNSFKTHHRWIGTASLDPPAATAGVGVYNANDIYRPLASSTHQPIGFEQMIPFYEAFTVVGSKITADFSPVGAATAVPLTLGIALRGYATPQPDSDTYMEQGNCHYRLHPGAAYRGSNARVTYKYNNTFLVGPNLTGQLLIPELEGTATSSPTQLAYYHVFAQASDKTSNPAEIQVLVTIEYAVVWKTPIKLLPSTV